MCNQSVCNHIEHNEELITQLAKIDKVYSKRALLRRSIINKKPLEDAYKRELYNHSRKYGKKLKRIANSPKVRSEIVKSVDNQRIKRYLEVTGYTVDVARMMLPVDVTLRNMEYSQNKIVSKLGERTYVLTKKFLIEQRKKDGIKVEQLAYTDTEIINQLLKQYSFESSSNTIAKYRKDIEYLVKEGIRTGKTQEEISSEVASYVNFTHEYNPQYVYDRIARNEVTRFSNESKISFWENQNVQYYGWIVGPGPCTEELICEMMGQGEPYIIGQGPMPIDDTHINCFCDIYEFNYEESFNPNNYPEEPINIEPQIPEIINPYGRGFPRF